MRKTLWISALLVGAGALAVGCGGDNPGCVGICLDAGDGGGDAGPPSGDAAPDARGDAGPCPFVPGRASGAACTSGDRCLESEGLACQPQIVGEVPSMNTVAVLPDGGIGQGRPFPYSGFTGGACYEACDINAQMDECGDCATCTDRGPQGLINFGAGGFFDAARMIDAICRPDCTPTNTDNGGCRDGWTCDLWSGTCVEACLNTTQCEFSISDPDGDGQGDIVDNGAGSGATCSTTTGRCDVPGTAGAVAGGDCADDTDCEANGLCLTFDDDPDGYCSRIGCMWPGFECAGTDSVCDLRAFGGGISACLEGCTVGAEGTDVSARRGAATGGNPTCNDPGMQCVWNGNSSSTDTLNGSCLPGNYNDTPSYNVGEACLDDADCFSPYGYGRCLFLGTATDRVQSGICVIGGCAGGAGGTALGLLGGDDAPVTTPVPDEVCQVGSGDLCVGFGGGATFCVQTCTSADECAVGYACPELLGDGTHLCWPNCTTNTDCRGGTTCRNTTGGTCGTDQECYCSDATPAPDGGTPVDGGTPATDGGTPATDGGADDAGPDAG